MLRILLLDDNPDDRMLAIRELQKQFADLQIQEVGSQAGFERALVDGLRVDVVITDYEMGWTNGMAILQTVKDRRPQLPVIMFTASGSEEVAVTAMKQGLDDYITKTAKHYPRLPYAVRACVERAQHRRLLEQTLENERLAKWRMQLALESARMGTWQVDIRSSTLMYSPEIGPMFGRAPGYTHPSFEAWLADVHPDDQANMLASWETALRGSGDYRTEFRAIGEDGITRWIASSGRAVRDEAGTVRLVIGTAPDISESKHAEVQRNFLLSLDERLRRLAEPRRIMAEAAEAVGLHLGAERCGYGEVDASGLFFTVREDWHTEQMPSLVGTLRLSDFSPRVIAVYRAGNVLCLNDTHDDPRIHAAEHVAYDRAGGIRAALGVPLIKDGRFVAAFYVHQRTPRRWTDEELRLTQEVAERTWAALEQARAEAALRESEHRFRVMADGLPILVWVTGADGGIQFVNRCYCEFFGTTQQQVQGAGWQPLLHPDDVQSYLCAFTDALQARSVFSAKARVRAASGAWRWIQSYGAPRFSADGSFLGYVGASPDVTDTVLATHALQQRQQELQAMFDVLPVGVAIAHDPRGDRITVSPQFARLLGFEPGDNVSASGLPREQLSYRALRDGLEVPGDEQPIQRAARTGREVRDCYLDLELRDGRVVNIMVNAAPLHDEQGQVRGAIGAIVDVTPMKKIQSELEAADRQKNEFLATLAHELRNPLAPIRYAVRLLREGAPTDAIAQARDVIDRQSAQMARLLDDLLDVSRITRNAIELQREPIDLRHAVELGVETARPLLDSVRHTLAQSLPAEPLMVLGDQARLAQVVSNLLHNAAKFTPPGGRIELRVRRKEHSGHDDQAMVEVIDNGIGIEPDKLQHVFELFSQVHSKLQGARGGLGIGLAVVQRLVELHGGKVEATSAGLGQGTRFAFALPLVNASAIRSTDNKAVPPPARQMHVLVVDDNIDAADALAGILRMDGYSVQTAYDGIAAMELAEILHPQLVVLDLGMPRANGYQVARWIRQQDWGANTRLVAVTGWGQDKDRDQTRKAGFDAHLVKPVDPQEIEQLVASFSAAEN